MDFDLAPTTPLPGFHFRGTVAQRLIANYPVPPEVLAPRVPLDAELCVADGQAWLSACMVQLHGLRPRGVPERLGMPFRYLVHRTMVHAPFPDGRRRKAVFVLEAYGDPAVPRFLGRSLGGAPFRKARIRWRRDGDRFHVEATRDRDVVYDATHTLGFASRHFDDASDADAFILGMSFGSHWDGAWRFFPETHDPWKLYGLRAETHRYALLEGLGVKTEADHVLAMEDCPHYFARPIASTAGRRAQA